jgi:hypothetical protein
MTFARRIDQLSIQEELSKRCAKFFEIARYVALEKKRDLLEVRSTA